MSHYGFMIESEYSLNPAAPDYFFLESHPIPLDTLAF